MRRWLPCLAMLLVSLISYVDRQTLAVLSPTILRDTHLTNAQFGWIISAFSVAYTLANPLWGRAIDRIGLPLGMLLAVSLWSLASAAHALAGGFVGFALARALLGFGEGATFPGALRTAVQTLPPQLRARGIAVAYSGGSLGAILTSVMVTPIAVGFGWRAAFVVTGLMGASWVLLWLWIGRAPSLRAPPATANPTVDGAPARLSDARLWAFMAIYALGVLPLGFVFYTAPIYLHQALSQSQESLGGWLMVPPIGWAVGGYFWGWLTDRLTRARPPAVVHRRLFWSLVLLGAPLALTPTVTRMPMAMALLFLATFVAAGFIIVGIAYATRIFSAAHAGFLGGAGAGAWSAVVALTMPLFGRMLDRHAYTQAFALAAALPLVGAVAWSVLDRYGCLQVESESPAMA